MKKLLIILILLPIIGIGFGQNVSIPDSNFKAYLINNTAINTNGDFEIQVSEATLFNGTINCGSLQITDLTGIEFFTSMVGLYCMANQIDSLNLSQNISLTNLDCGFNQLTSLDVSNCTSLELLRCQGNSIDSLDLKNQINLFELYCNNNQLYSLDLRNCSNFLFGSNPNSSEYDSRNNPNLTCINVDDSIFSTTNWLNVDSQQYFTNNCNQLVSWDCINNSCFLLQTGNGAYNSLCACESACSIVPTWDCVNNFCVEQLNGSGFYTSESDCINNCGITSIDEQFTNKKLLRVIDVLGRKVHLNKNEILFYIYDDGSIDKKFIIE